MVQRSATWPATADMGWPRVRLTVGHYSFTGGATGVGASLHSRQAWDALRLSDAEDFAIPESRNAWLDSFVKRDYLRRGADAIVSLCRTEGLGSVYSVGVGGAGVEYFIKTTAPDLLLTCTDYAPEATRRVARVFTECDRVEAFDFANGRWQARPDTLCLLHRVDTELSDSQWRACFSRMAGAGITPVLVVATGFLTARSLAKAGAARLQKALGMHGPTFCGYVRTREAFCSLWDDDYVVAREVQIGDFAGFLLKRRAATEMALEMESSGQQAPGVR